MSFLKANPFSGLGAAMNPSGAAEGIGKLLNVSPLGVSRFADTVGKVANGFAAGGGATPGFTPPDNHMQLLDQDALQRIIQQFGGRPQAASQTGYSR